MADERKPISLAEIQARQVLECRRCGCRDLRVVYTELGANGTRRRRRECRHCGARYTTVEVIYERGK